MDSPEPAPNRRAFEIEAFRLIKGLISLKGQKGTAKTSTLSGPTSSTCTKGPSECSTLAGATSSPCTLDQARALLANDPHRCAELGSLPAGYSHHEPADFEEFFQPELALEEAKGAPGWGTLEEPTDLHDDQVEAIAATIAELHRSFDHTLPLSARLRFRLMAACRDELRLLVAELEGGGHHG